ncbi:hypothetical protein FRC17_001910 [Serendipita sp. 399]|nr:hypothetical protein FRC17_001910 [Serendipita sp. 399]
MSVTVPYSEFQTPDNALTESGGTWTYQRSSSEVYCNTFSYHFKWASDQVPAGYPLSAQLAVGSSSNTDSFVSSDPAQLWIDNPILGDPFTHSGTTSALRSADGSTGYIPIILDFTFPRPPPSRCYWFLVARSFRITTPTFNGGSSPSPSSAPGPAPPSSVAVMISSTSISVGSTTVSGSVMPVSVAVPIVQTLMTLVLPAPGTSNNNGGNIASDGSSGRGGVQTSAIVGGVVGAIAFLGLILALAIFLLRKQRRRSLEQGEKEMIQGGGGGGLDGRRRKDSMHQGALAGTTGTPVAFSRPTSFASSPSSSEPGRRVSVATSILPATTFRPISSSRVVEPVSENGAAPDRRSAATGGGGGRGQRRRGHQTLFLAGPTPMTATYSDVPPPAYSDVNGTTGITYYHGEEDEGDETGEEDEGEGGTSMSRSPVTNPSSPIVHGQSTGSESVDTQRAQETRVPLGEKSGL